MSAPDILEARIRAMVLEADGIMSVELRAPDGRELPPFTAGAHIDLHLPTGLIRSYSLLNDAAERHRYVIAVGRDKASRGGSQYVHERLRVGDTTTLGVPRNNFPLAEDAADTLLIAGGIGITPVLCMIRRLHALNRPWRLHYCTRTRRHAAFLDELLRLAGNQPERVKVNFDGEQFGKMLDIAQVVNAERPDTHLYCCGPLPMLDAFERATAGRNPATVHLEYFAARSAPATAGGFELELRRSGKTLTVPPGKTILDVVMDAGVAVSYSCSEGICGSCETKVLEGQPDHRDLVLSKEEQAAGKTMMICCSGCKGSKLVLDL